MDLINLRSKNLKVYSKIVGTLGLMNQVVICKSGSFVRPAAKVKNKREGGASQGPLATSKLAVKKKEQSRRKGCKVQGLTPMVNLLTRRLNSLLLTSGSCRESFLQILDGG